MTRSLDRTGRELAQLLSTQAGLRLDGAGQFPEAVLARAAQRAGVATVEGYAAAVASGTASLTPLVEETRIGETYFFREPHQLAFLQRQVLAPAAASGAALRLWSAGCASGEEPYSVAMMLAKAGLEGEVLGTDISGLAVAAAERAVYGTWSLRGPWKERAREHLTANGDGTLQLAREIRARVRWRTHNLVGELPPAPVSAPAWDAILCRNVLIYFDEVTQQRVIEMLAGALRPGGFLLLGSCDPPAASASPLLEAIVADEGVFYRRRGSTEPLAAPARTTEPAPGLLPPTARAPRSRPRPRKNPAASPKPMTVTGPPPPVRTGPPPPVPTGPPPPWPAEPTEAHRLCLQGFEALELGERDAALDAFRRALYLAPDLLIAELASAALFAREGDSVAAVRGYKRALRLARAAPDDDDEVPLASGATFGDITAHCRRTLVTLGDRSEGSP